MSRHRDHFRIADASIRLDSMPEAGRDLQLSVGAKERATIAERIEVTELKRLEVKLHAVRFKGGMRVNGTLEAVVVQPSVVSLEPVQQEVSEPIDRVFLPSGEKSFAEQAGAEIFVDLEGEDFPDHFEGTEADLTELIIETVALALDPYPRLEGESVDTLGINEQDEDESPFAKLKALKDPGHDS